ncbi:gamma-glutamyltransferase [Clostridium transplantifaecale]|uniref:gamma-glutamyltransferase n=1 Tax=Clostridium transplantifaecale TaxID=2479838 RepID=UPI000F62E4BB|nr:gamma-glutamyltransferase [Clostridium transplantifaecale]
MRKKSLALFLAAALATSVTGCQTKTTPPATEAVQESAVQTEAPEETKEAPAAEEGWKPYDENGQIKRDDRDANGKNGVVSTGKYEASKIGADIIEAGGNAVDAAVAVGFALGVCEPQSSGIGGGGFMLIHSAETGENVFVDFREPAPSKAEPGMWPVDKDGELTDDTKWLGGPAVGVPGEVKGLLYALDTYGTMTREEVMNPAIEMAENGYEVSAVLNRDMMEEFEVLTRFKACGDIYLKEGFPYSVGDVIKNPDLAKTLSLIRDNGPDAFYKGAMAEAMVKAVQESGGVLTLEDLANYDIKLRTPVSGTYRGYEILSSPPPSSGGTTIVEILNILENFDIKGMGHNSVEHLHTLTEAMKMAYKDRGFFAADTDFIDVPLTGMASKEYAKELASQIDPEKAQIFEHGDAWAYESPQTTHYSIMDKQGNIVAVTKTINYVFGSGLVPEGYGFIMNDEMDDFDAEVGTANEVQPGKRPMSSMSPTIILKDGKPVMTIGAPGSQRIISGVAQVISNVIDFDMDIQDAISAPRIHAGSDWTTSDETIMIETRVDNDVIEGLKALGHPVLETGDWMDYPCVQAVEMLPDGTLRGGADPRRDGKAVGY